MIGTIQKREKNPHLYKNQNRKPKTPQVFKNVFRKRFKMVFRELLQISKQGHGVVNAKHLKPVSRVSSNNLKTEV